MSYAMCIVKTIITLGKMVVRGRSDKISGRPVVSRHNGSHRLN